MRKKTRPHLCHEGINKRETETTWKGYMEGTWTGAVIEVKFCEAKRD